MRARRNIGNLRRGETIIIVNWNTRDVLRDTIAAVRRLSPKDVPITDGLTFQVFKMPEVDTAGEVWGENAFDTAEWMSRMVAPDELHFLETTPNPVAGLPGMTSGGVVYHHGGVIRAASGGMDPTSYAQWRDALDQLLPQ